MAQQPPHDAFWRGGVRAAWPHAGSSHVGWMFRRTMGTAVGPTPGQVVTQEGWEEQATGRREQCYTSYAKRMVSVQVLVRALSVAAGL